MDQDKRTLLCRLGAATIAAARPGATVTPTLQEIAAGRYLTTQRGRFTQPLLDSDISSASEQLGQGSADFLYECGRQASGVGHLGGRALGNARARLTNRSRSSQISFPGNHYGSGGAAQLGQIAGFGDRLAAAKHCSYTEMPLLDL